jgi:hypothetical protein
MADVITGNTQLSATKQALIISLVQKELKFAAKLAGTVTDYSAFAVKGAKSISVPKLTSFTVTNRASEAAGEAAALTSSVDTIALDFNAYVSWIIDSFDEAQTTIDAQVEFAKRAASAHGRYVDSQLLTKIKAAAGFEIDAVSISSAHILAMREELLKNDADMANLQLVVGPDQEKIMLGLSEFTKQYEFGSPTIQTGMIGKVYGIPVIVHNGMPAAEAYMYDKAGVGLAFQKAPSMGEQPEIAYGVGAKRVAIDQVFGISALQLGEKSKGATKSPLIAVMYNVP